MSILDNLSRRDALKATLFAAAGLAVPSLARADWCYVPGGRTAVMGATGTNFTDEDVFNFALNLESLEAEYYLRGTTGQGMSAADAGPNPGKVSGGKMVPWKNENLQKLLYEVALNELAHVRFYRKQLGELAVSRPEIDIAGGFAGAAKA